MTSETSDPFSAYSLESIFGQGFSAASDIRLLWKGRHSFKTIFDALREANEFICLVFYIFRNDETGQALATLLKKKTRQGVKVYLLYDHFGSFGTPLTFWEELRASGINVMASRPIDWKSPLNYFRRDHRKLIVIDSVKIFTGGLNIADEYSGGLRFSNRKTGWRDTGIMIEGPIAAELLKTFVKSWYAWGGGQILNEETYAAPKTGVINKIKQLGHRLFTKKFKERAESMVFNNAYENGIPVMPIFVDSAKSRRSMRRVLYYSIGNAKKKIDLTTAYFIPSRHMMDTLEQAVSRGVRVRLLVPGITDVPAASYAGRAFFDRLIKAGVEIYTYKGVMIHAKTFIFDDCWSIIGSTNLDFQSLRYNDEGNVGILDAAFAVKMTSVFEKDLKHSIKIDHETWKQRPLTEKFREFSYSLLRRRL